MAAAPTEAMAANSPAPASWSVKRSSIDAKRLVSLLRRPDRAMFAARSAGSKFCSASGIEALASNPAADNCRALRRSTASKAGGACSIQSKRRRHDREHVLVERGLVVVSVPRDFGRELGIHLQDPHLRVEEAAQPGMSVGRD